MVRGLEHIAIATPDTDALAGWYAANLDFAVEAHHPETGTYFIRSADNSRIEIIRGERAAAKPELSDGGLRHLALITDDFDTDYARLHAAGVVWLSPAEVRGGNRVAFFRDPDGNVCHLIQRPVPLAR